MLRLLYDEARPDRIKRWYILDQTRTFKVELWQDIP
jgi:hypothetical protein